MFKNEGEKREQSRIEVKNKLLNRIQTMKHSIIALERIAATINVKDDNHYVEDIYSYIKESTAFRDNLIEYHRLIMYAKNTL